MASNIHHTERRRTSKRSTFARALLPLLMVGCLFLPAEHAQAEGGAPANPPAEDPNARIGAALFDQCVYWVSRGGQGVDRARDFYVKLTARLDLDRAQHEGPLRLWWAGNGMFRQEMTTRAGTTTKILNVQRPGTPNEFAQMWTVDPSGRVRRMHGSSGGSEAIQQLREDAERLGDLAQFMTLRELKGPNVRFIYEGYKEGRDDYAGKWVKVTRKLQGSADISFWFAYERDQAGNVRATWPGIVRVAGNRELGYPTEDYILKEWKDSPAGQPRGFRYPRDIIAYSWPLEGRGPARRFLQATVQDIKINAGIDPARFRPAPVRRGGQPGPGRNNSAPRLPALPPPVGPSTPSRDEPTDPDR